MNEQRPIDSEQALKALFDQAVRRQEPPAAAEKEVRAAVFAEWQGQNRRRYRRRALVAWALAASLVLAAYLALDTLRLAPTAMPEPVARIELHRGPVSILDGERRVPLPGDEPLLSGQTIQTSRDAVVTLDWLGGGALRIASNSRLRLRGADEVELQSGAIYFDSAAGSAPAAAPLAVRTPVGFVRHVGTQFLAELTNDTVVVRVREGRVEIDGSGYANVSIADGGAELFVDGYSEFDDEPHGEAWRWVAAAAPARDFDGRFIIEFLRWFCRETGRELRFEPASLEEVAGAETLSWPDAVQPTSETLSSVLSTTDLRSAVVGREVVIRPATY